jgi:hypothetical protein
MKFQLDFTPEISLKKIQLGDKITLLGSCFSDEIALRLRNSGFEVLANPFGTIFHPTAIANLLLFTQIENTIFQRDDLFFSWIAAGSIYSTNPESLKNTLVALQNHLIEFIHSSKFLFITFGTSYAYENESFGSVVANCHKMPNTNFFKVLSSVNEMNQDWNLTLEKIYAINPDIQVIFTVSPVRHIKDGIVQNNQSKARLVELTNRLSEMTPASYFPSYEILIDVLRDYRFYKADLLHPNELAVDYIYKQLENVFMDEQTQQVTEQVRRLKASENHKLLYPESIKSIEFETVKNQRIANFLKNNPKVIW